MNPRRSGDPRSGLALLALLRVRECRADRARLELAQVQTAAREARAHARGADDSMAGALAWSAGAEKALRPELHARTMDHVARLAAAVDRTSVEVERQERSASECRDRLQGLRRECDMLERARAKLDAAVVATLNRQGWNAEDDAWISGFGREATP
jgi:hypothetical protein